MQPKNDCNPSETTTRPQLPAFLVVVVDIVTTFFFEFTVAVTVQNHSFNLDPPHISYI